MSIRGKNQPTHQGCKLTPGVLTPGKSSFGALALAQPNPQSVIHLRTPTPSTTLPTGAGNLPGDDGNGRKVKVDGSGI
jgi:hypothetical protein